MRMGPARRRSPPSAGSGSAGRGHARLAHQVERGQHENGRIAIGASTKRARAVGRARQPSLPRFERSEVSSRGRLYSLGLPGSSSSAQRPRVTRAVPGGRDRRAGPSCQACATSASGLASRTAYTWPSRRRPACPGTAGGRRPCRRGRWAGRFAGDGGRFDVEIVRAPRRDRQKAGGGEDGGATPRAPGRAGTRRCPARARGPRAGRCGSDRPATWSSSADARRALTLPRRAPSPRTAAIGYFPPCSPGCCAR